MTTTPLTEPTATPGIWPPASAPPRPRWPPRARWPHRAPMRCSTIRSPNRWSRPSGSTTSSGWSTARSTVDDDPVLNRRPDERADRRPHPVLRRLLHRSHRCRYSAGRHPGLRPRHPRLPAAVAGRHRGVRDRPTRGDRVQDPDARRPRRRTRPPTAAPSAIDLRDDWPTALARQRIRSERSRPRGSPKVC